MTTPAVDEATIALLNRLGAGYIDLHDLDLPTSSFYDDHHLNHDGAVAYTAALGAALRELGALDDSAPMAKAGRPLPSPVRSAAISDGEQTTGASGSSARSVRFLGGKRSSFETTYSEKPPPVRHKQAVKLPSGMWAIEVEQLAPVSMNALIKHVPGMDFLSRCTPVRLKEGGEPLERADNQPSLLAGPPGQWVVRDDRVILRPKKEGARHQVLLAHSRSCRGYTWFYPGDRAEIAMTKPGQLHIGATHLELGGFVLGPGDGSAKVTLETEAGLHLVAEIPISALDGDPVILKLDVPVPATPEQLVLRVETPKTAPFVLLHFGALTTP